MYSICILSNNYLSLFLLAEIKIHIIFSHKQVVDYRIHFLYINLYENFFYSPEVKKQDI